MDNARDHSQLETASPTPEPIQKPKKYARWGGLGLFIVLGAIAYTVYMTSQWHQATERKLRTLNAQFQDMQAAQEQTTSQLTTAAERVKAAEERAKLLEQQVNTVLQNHLHQTQGWLLHKARYYLELAQINAHWRHDNQETADLLSLADKVLADSHEKAVFGVRQAIAEAQAKVSAAEKLDRAGLLSQLDAAQKLSQHLQVKPMPGETAITQPVEPDNKSALSNWRESIKNSFRKLEKLVVVQRVDDGVQRLMTPAYAKLAQANIQLLLQETQLAVLQGSEALYQLTLKQALEKINQMFDSQNEDTQVLVKQLMALQQQSIDQKSIDVGQALLLLNQLLDTTLDAHPAQNTVPSNAGDPS
jgi:uroporphyrin-3 C-methyltransferase